MTLVDRLTKVYDRAYSVSDKLGVRQHVDFVIVDRATQNLIPVSPRPRLSSPPVHRMQQWGSQNVEVNSTDKYITGLSRTYEEIQSAAIVLIDNKPYSILWIGTDRSITFDILVRPERSR